MIENIVIREAVTEEERSLFWERLRAYFCRDIFPDPEDEDRPYFLGDDYRRTMESLRTRPVHPVHWLVFSRNGQDVALPWRRCSPARTANASFWSSACCRSTGAAEWARPAPGRC